MKKRYPFGPKNWACFGLTALLTFTFTGNILAQTAPVKHWDKVFGGSDHDNPTAFQITADGGYVMAGFSESPVSSDKTQANLGNLDFWIVKLDAAGNKRWDKTFGATNLDALVALVQTSDGGYLAGGESYSNIAHDKSQNCQGFADFWVIKLDSVGNKLWDKTIGGSDYDYFNTLIQTADGGFLLAGSSLSITSGDKTSPLLGGSDYWVVKLDAQGNKLWDKTYGGLQDDLLFSVLQTPDGNYLLGGQSESGVSGNKTEPSKGISDFWLIKIDALGNKLWEKVYGGTGEEGITNLAQLPDGSLLLTGISNSGISGDKTQASKGGFDFWIVKTNANGTKLWDKTYGGSFVEATTDLVLLPGGGMLVSGNSNSPVSGDKTEPGAGSNDLWVLRLDATGNKLWDKTIGSAGIDFLIAARPTANGEIILAADVYGAISGDKSQASKGGSDFWLIKLGAAPTGTKETTASYTLAISPNPNQGKFTLQLNNLPASKTELAISDLLGRTILQQEFKAINNRLSEEINLPNAKGIYLLQLKAGNQMATRKIVVK